MSVYDAVAPSFDRHRALPEAAARAIRTAVLDAAPCPRPRLLDLGAGSGRTGWTFVAGGDDYVGADLSYGMLQAFKARPDIAAAPALVQADGCALPFAPVSFDAVLLVQVFGGLTDWRRLIGEARRVLRRGGRLMLGRTVTDTNGIDARMKRKLAMLMPQRRKNVREEAERELAADAAATAEVIAARWNAERTPRGFLDRHATGAQFAQAAPALRTQALRALADWAAAEFGSLDARFTETQRFELRVFTFAQG
jgi:ubiquinone/menaquinone biosynthesis C-methylase UbiE